MLSRSQPPLVEDAVWARAHDPEWTTDDTRARLLPQSSAGTAEVSKPGSGTRFAGGGEPPVVLVVELVVVELLVVVGCVVLVVVELLVVELLLVEELVVEELVVEELVVEELLVEELLVEELDVEELLVVGEVLPVAAAS